MFLLVDKPKRMTSHDVVDNIRKVSGEKTVGHAGTLDPNATGLLIVGIGRVSTKKLSEIAKETSKTYEAEIILGETRDTDDVEGKVVSKSADFVAPGEIEIRLILATFLGEKEQLPPAFSAVKIKGKKAYELARKGKKVELKPREITIYSIKLVDYKYPTLNVITTVSAGTYVRALARDIGHVLGCGAYLNNLKRTEIGRFSLDDAILLKKLTKKNWKRHLIKLTE